MKVRELIEQLSELDPEMSVVVAEDTEANYYSDLPSVAVGWYRPRNGEFHGDPDPSDVEDLDDEEDEQFTQSEGDVRAVAIR